MARQRIFIVDDEPGMILIARILLEGEGFAVYSETNPARALEKIKGDPPDLLLSDIAMPELNGLDLCRAVKSIPRLSGIPVIFMSVRREESDVVAGLELGADDYVQKPIRERELLARVRAVLRRKGMEGRPREIVLGPFRLDFEAYKAWIDSELVSLTPKQFELLGLLVQNEGRVLTRSSISQGVWGTDFTKLSRTIDSTVDQVRRKLGPYRSAIRSLKGVGYRFEWDEP